MELPAARLRHRIHGLPWAELAVVAFAAVIARVVATHPSLLPPWAPWNFCWPGFLAAGFALLWFLRGLYRAPAAERMPGWRCACFLVGFAAIYAVLLTRLEDLAEHMFFLNRVQHAVLHHFGPFLIALSWPGATMARGMPAWAARGLSARPIRMLLRPFQQPLVAACLFEGLLLFWLIPPVTFWAMLDWRLYDIMNASMLVDGLLFWFLVLDPRPNPPAPIGFLARLAAGFLIIFPQILIGTSIGLARHDLYPTFSLCGRVYPSIGPLLDQEIGGLVLWEPTSMMSAVAALVVMWRLFHYEDALSGRAPAAAARYGESKPVR